MPTPTGRSTQDIIIEAVERVLRDGYFVHDGLIVTHNPARNSLDYAHREGGSGTIYLEGSCLSGRSPNIIDDVSPQRVGRGELVLEDGRWIVKNPREVIGFDVGSAGAIWSSGYHHFTVGQSYTSDTITIHNS